VRCIRGMLPRRAMILCHLVLQEDQAVNSPQSTYPRFWSLFHSDWYRSIYLHKKTLVVPTKEVNWDWIAAKKNSIFNKIKATCDELEMTPLMSFKYDWNEELFCQFYATFYFDVAAQKLL
jgi:hypothetical protein